jgi:tripartite-type tricarboxylate transporter receptor subunit TctC
MRRLLLALLLAAAPVAAQEWPAQPVRLVVPFAAGGQTDIASRILAEHLSRTLGQRIVVENRTGAGVVVGTDVVARAAPDGHVLLYTTIAHAVLKPLVARLPFDPDADFAPVIHIGAVPNAIVVARDVPAQTLPEFIALLRARPNTYDAAFSGVGSATHLALALFGSMAGVEFTMVPYRGSGAIYPDLAAGRVHFAAPVGLTLARDPALRTLAVTTARRARTLPDVPTVAEAGLPGYEAYSWHMVFAPRATPAPVVARINAVVAAALADADVARRMAEAEMELDPGTPPEAAALLARESAKWADILQRIGAVPQ